MHFIYATNLTITDLYNLKRLFPYLPNKAIKAIAPRATTRKPVNSKKSEKKIKRRRESSDNEVLLVYFLLVAALLWNK